MSYKKLIILVLAALISGCDSAQFSVSRSEQLQQTDHVIATVQANAKNLSLVQIANVDHSRLAEKEGAVLNASQVALFSDARLNTALLQDNIRVGLDLPFKVLAYAQSEEIKTKTTGADFLKKRHNLKPSKALNDYQKILQDLTQGLPGIVKNTPVLTVTPNYGIVEINSKLGFSATVKALKAAVLSEGDTVWFTQVDYHTEAELFSVALPKSSLLIFGAPSPGAKAMHEFPAIGLDAFPQKVLVYESASVDGKSASIKVIYNDMPALSELHYGSTGVPLKVIKYRLYQTLSGAVSE
jgi:uncharacterized protein (DUF302 family)